MDILCIDFVNSQWYVTHKTYREMLYDNELLLNFFNKRYLDIDIPPDASVTESLFALRSLLSELLREIAFNRHVPDDGIQKINRYIGMSTFCRNVEEKNGVYSISLKPLLHDWDWIMSEIASSFIELIGNYDLDRIKICENPECGWFFYDESKSRTRRWCDDTCGNLMKVRRFRAKQKNR